MRKLGKYLREDGKKFMAIASAILMIAFFLPNLRGGKDPQEVAAMRQVGTVFDGQKITAGEQGALLREWDLLRHRLLWSARAGDEQMYPIAGILGQGAVAQIDANPATFMLLVEEAHKLGIGVSNDQLQDILRSHIPNMPDETDQSYDLAHAAVSDLLLVNNLLLRVGDVVKVSQPQQVQMLALTEQDVSLNMAQLSAKQNVGAETPPTQAQIDAEYQKYKALLPGTSTDDNTLGFGYCLPDRVKVQYLGFNMPDIRAYVISSRPQIEWTTLARRQYREHTDDFPIATTAPTTQTTVLGPPAWENLPPDVASKVYDRVYDTAAGELAKKMLDHMTEEMASDWATYKIAASSGQAAPVTDLGVPMNSDDYMRKLAEAMHSKFGPGPVLGIINNGWKTADDLALLEGIGKAATQKGQSFGQYATTAGDQFKTASLLMDSDRLALWQPSAAVYTGLAGDPNETVATSTGFYIFRLSGMDPSHSESADEAKDQVISDLMLQQAWNATVADADKMLAAAKKSGIDAVAMNASPRPTMLKTDYFNLSSAQSTGVIPGTDLQPQTAKALAKNVTALLEQPAAGERAVTEVKLPLERMVAVVELTGVRGSWENPGDQMLRQTALAQEMEMTRANQLREIWSVFSQASKRTDYKDTSKQ